MTELVTGQDFRGFVRGYQHTAFRLEVRDQYNEPGEAEPLQRFLAGESIGDWYEDWEELQRRWAAEGKQMTRVRVVTEPHTDYIRFGQYLEFRRMFRVGQRTAREELAGIEAATDFTRNFESVFVPGLLQTPEYARYRFAERLEDIGAPDDVDDAVAARMNRQQVIYRTGKRFRFVVTEAVLRYLLCPPEVMAGQLDRLVSLSTLTTLRFGVIPFEVQYTVAPVHGFYVYDERMVRVENLTAVLKLTQPSEVAAYTKLFDQFAEVARYGAEARAIITRALADLTADTE